MENIKFVANKFSRRIPYSYAKHNQVCIYGVDGDEVLVAVVDKLNPIVISEVKRKLNEPIQVTKINSKTFDSLLSEAYSSSNAAAIVDDVQDDIDISDLIHNLPRTSDLLESDNDAPVIRIINAFLKLTLRPNPSVNCPSSEVI